MKERFNKPIYDLYFEKIKNGSTISVPNDIVLLMIIIDKRIIILNSNIERRNVDYYFNFFDKYKTIFYKNVNLVINCNDLAYNVYDGRKKHLTLPSNKYYNNLSSYKSFLNINLSSFYHILQKSAIKSPIKYKAVLGPQVFYRPVVKRDQKSSFKIEDGKILEINDEPRKFFEKITEEYAPELASSQTLEEPPCEKIFTNPVFDLLPIQDFYPTIEEKKYPVDSVLDALVPAQWNGVYYVCKAVDEATKNFYTPREIARNPFIKYEILTKPFIKTKERFCTMEFYCFGNVFVLKVLEDVARMEYICKYFFSKGIYDTFVVFNHKNEHHIESNVEKMGFLMMRFL